jgi:hypothetical protein
MSASIGDRGDMTVYVPGVRTRTWPVLNAGLAARRRENEREVAYGVQEE